MRPTLLRPTSAAWLARDPEDAGPHEADQAVAALRSDYERWSRWAWGVGAFGGLVLGGGTVVGVVAEVLRQQRAAVIDVVLLAPFVALAAGCGVLLVRLHRTGRVLASAAGAWLRRPGAHRGGHPARGWLEARTVNLEPPLLLRLVTATLALLLGVGGLSLFGRDVVQGLVPLSWSALAVGLLGLAAGLGQAGGVLRLVAGLAEHDPVWRRLR